MTPATPGEPSSLIEALGLAPHPEGGWYRQTWQGPPAGPGARAVGSAIYYLLQPGERSGRHRVDADETWHHYRGGAVELLVDAGGAGPERIVLGPRVAAGQRPQCTVPAGAWQEARPLGTAALLGCTMAPGFVWEGFDMTDNR